MESEEKAKEQEIQDAREYAESIINAVREPLMVLDGGLRVISVSQSFYDIFKVKPEETVGQFIYDVGNRQWDIPKLRELLEGILPNNVSFDNFEVTHDFPDIGKRVMLLNARQIPRASEKTHIILLAIEDITEPKKILDGLHDKIKELETFRSVAATKDHRIAELKRMVGELQLQLLRRQR